MYQVKKRKMQRRTQNHASRRPAAPKQQRIPNRENEQMRRCPWQHHLANARATQPQHSPNQPPMAGNRATHLSDALVTWEQRPRKTLPTIACDALCSYRIPEQTTRERKTTGVMKKTDLGAVAPRRRGGLVTIPVTVSSLPASLRRLGGRALPRIGSRLKTARATLGAKET